MPRPELVGMPKHLEVPLLCRSSNLLLVLLISQLFVILAWLINFDNTSMHDFANWASYSMWLVIMLVASLCGLRNYFYKVSYILGALSMLAIMILGLILVDVVVLFLLSEAVYFQPSRLSRLSLMVVLVWVLSLWAFNLIASQKVRLRAQEKAKVLALQARIQPHFLFNALNTISELTASAPKEAEQAIDSLASLFRANLENSKNMHSLNAELGLCRKYVALESWRFGEKLLVSWNVEVNKTRDIIVPKLLLQPLLENAIKYGQLADGSIIVKVDVRETKGNVSFRVENKLFQECSGIKGSGIAQKNIRERLLTLYDDRQVFKVRQEKDSYSVLVRIPKSSLADAPSFLA